MNEYLKNIMENQSIIKPDGERIPLHSSVSLEEGLFIQKVIAKVQPKSSLEVGLAFGISAMFICDALSKQDFNGKHIIIDPGQIQGGKYGKWEGLGLINLEKAGFLNMIEFYEEGSEYILPKLAKQGKRMQFAFIDGWHTFDHVLIDFFYINRMLDIGGVIVFDDVNMPAIGKLIRYILNYPAYKLFDIEGVEKSNANSLMRMISKFILKKYPFFNIGSTGLLEGCVAIIKICEDERDWDWFKNF